VTATNASQLNATTGNEQVSKAINKLVVDSKGKKGMAGGGLLALNKVSSVADAYIGPRSYDYLAGQVIEELSRGMRVSMDGGLYEYISEARWEEIDLGTEDYADTSLWKKLSDTIEEFQGDSMVTARGELKVAASDTSSINSNSRVVVTSVTENRIFDAS